MISFISDYTEGAHPEILRRLTETNLVQTSGYGTDPYTLSALEEISAASHSPAANVVFVVGWA